MREPKEPAYLIYKDCPGKPLRVVNRIRGHSQAYAQIQLLDAALSPEEKAAQCGHWLAPEKKTAR